MMREQQVYLSVGCHPKKAGLLNFRRLENLKEMILNNPKVVAVGEIGLDYYGRNVPEEEKGQQTIVFKAMLNLAVQHEMPVILHIRGATEEARDILSKVERLVQLSLLSWKSRLFRF